jgi:DNA modification methylase
MDLNKIYQGDALSVLKTFPDNSIDTCITSPPYFQQRDYGTATWIGGDPNCDHKPKFKKSRSATVGNDVKDIGKTYYDSVCKKCGAVRDDKQIGLEATPEMYVQNIVEIFREVRRVLKKEGTLWINLGDTYNGSGKASSGGGRGEHSKIQQGSEGSLQIEFRTEIEGYKPKDLIGIPWMVGFALRSDGWYLRQDIIWHKKNCMPASVTDRCTTAHEYIFLMSKSLRYYYDQKSILEPAQFDGRKDTFFKGSIKYKDSGQTFAERGHEIWKKENDENGEEVFVRNKRSVWEVNLRPFREAHFAVFPGKLVIPMIKAGCPKGGIVLDPFIGSGTVAIESRRLERNFIGIELNPKYIEMANKRIKQKLGIFL